MLSVLQKVGVVAAEQTNESWKPDADLLQSISGLATDLQAKMTIATEMSSDIEETLRNLRLAMKQNAGLRDRILAYLARVLPGGKNDPLLLEFGLRKKFSRGRSPSVTVVHETPESEETEESSE